MKDLDFIYKRKSVRKFKDEEVPKEDIVELLKAATYAPSPKHQQNWHFIVLQNKEMIDEMAKIVRDSHERIGSIAKTEKDQKIHMSVIDYYTAFKNAPVVVLVYGCEYKMIEYKILKENNASQEVLDILKSPQSGAQAIGAAVEYPFHSVHFQLSPTFFGYHNPVLHKLDLYFQHLFRLS